MKENRNIFLIILLNLILSLLVVFISPRFDIVTLCYFLVVNAIILFLLVLNEKHKINEIKSKVDNIFYLLHSLDADIDNYEVVDDEFGGLRDEIIKVIGEKRNITDSVIKNEEILKEYTEDIAHQLKTPLTGILLMLDLLEEDEKNKKEYIQHIRKSSNRLHQLVDILLKLAALDSRTIKMKKEHISAKKLVFEVIKEMEIIFENNNFRTHIFGEDYELVCDKKWTYEAVYNIVKNGIEASNNKGVNIYLKETNIYQSIIVEDFSSGMSDETLKKVYKRFHKGNKDSKGYGIGLPMAKDIMEKQNGEIIYLRGKQSNCFELRFYKD